MKIRNDFVTNSSSSSFIAVFGTAINLEKAKKSLDETKLNSYSISGKKLLEKYYDLKRKHTCDDWCWVDPFPDKEDIKENGLYFIYSDCLDVSTDEYGDIDENEVEEHYEYIASVIKKLEGFEFDVECGSGRNG